MGKLRSGRTAEAIRHGKKKPPVGGWVLAAYKAAVLEGMSPTEFWELTPYLTTKAMPGLIDRTTKAAWMMARMYRTKKLADLKTYLSKTPRDSQNRMLELKSALAGIGKR